MPDKTALEFVAAINAHDVERLIGLMSDDHLFIDAYGNRENKAQMTRGWPGYFDWFPDYRIEIDDVLTSDAIVVLLGFAGGAYRADNNRRWRLPAAWRAVIENGKVKIWQVYCDSKIPFDLMNKAEQRDVAEKAP